MMKIVIEENSEIESREDDITHSIWGADNLEISYKIEEMIKKDLKLEEMEI